MNIKPLTDDELGNHDLDHLWMVRSGEDYYGPFEEAVLKAYYHEHQAELAQSEVTTVGHENWSTIHSVEVFAAAEVKRTPKLVSRSELQAPTLPKAPTEEVLLRGQSVHEHSKVDHIREGLASLAYVGQKKNSTTSVEEFVPSLPEEEAPPRKWNLAWKPWAVATLVIVAASVWWKEQPDSAIEEKIVTVEDGALQTLPPGTSLMERANTRRARPRRPNREPSSVRPSRSESRRAIRDTRRDLMDYHQESTPQDVPEEHSPAMDVDPYPADSQTAQDDKPHEEIRRPAGDETEDSYKLEDPGAPQNQPIVEEVGDF